VYSSVAAEEDTYLSGHRNGGSTDSYFYQGEESVTVPDAHLLFSGEFKRAGSDLVLIGEHGQRFTISNYFAGEMRAALLSPEGASLGADIVAALAGPASPGQMAEGAPGAAAPAPAATANAIGRVETVAGDATVVRNGVAITLNVGDLVLKGDIVQTGQASSLAITFIDGTAFNLSSSARMVLNEMVYSEGAAGNQSLISLVEGSISFLAGQIAKTGDMRVETPVTTMGIRGTAVLVDIASTDGRVLFSVMVETNGAVGSYDLIDKTTGNVITTVNSSDTLVQVTPTGAGQISVQSIVKTAQQFQQETAIVAFLTPLATIPQFNQPGDQQPGGPNLNPRAGRAGGSSGVGDSGDGASDSGFGDFSDLRVAGLLDRNGGSSITAILPGEFRFEETREAFFPAAAVPPPTVTVIAINDFQTPISFTTTVSIPNQVEVAGGVAEFVSNTATLQSITAPQALPPGVNPASLVTLNPQLGTIVYDNSSFAFLGAGESITFTVQFKSLVAGQVVTETLPITITGINDAPTAASSPASVTVAEPSSPPVFGPAQTAQPSPVSETAQVRATGTLAFADKDNNDTHTVSIKALDGARGVLLVDGVVESTATTPGEVKWAYVADKADLQSLSGGQTEIERFEITITDSMAKSVTQVVSVTVTGVNDKPIVTLTPVVDTATPAGEAHVKTFLLGETASIFDPDLLDQQTNYLPYSGMFISVDAPGVTVGDRPLDQLIAIDQKTGLVTYDTSRFSFLGSGQEVVYTLHFHTQSGVDETEEYVKFTITGADGAGQAPVASFSSSAPLQSAPATVPATPSAVIAGTALADDLKGIGGDNTITGGGGNDTFHFTTADGRDVITDFHTAAQAGVEHDLIVVDAALFATAQAVLGAAVDTGAGDVLIATPEHSLLLKGVSVSMLSSNDFILA
jgi:VCBS repeat-containing protein